MWNSRRLIFLILVEIISPPFLLVFLGLFQKGIILMYVCAYSVVSNSLWPHGLWPAGSLVHGILQARILEWAAMPSSRGSSQPRDQTQVSLIAGGFFTIWATRVLYLLDTDLHTLSKQVKFSWYFKESFF